MWLYVLWVWEKGIACPVIEGIYSTNTAAGEAGQRLLLDCHITTEILRLKGTVDETTDAAESGITL